MEQLSILFIVIVFLFLLLEFRKSISLLFTKWIYGEYTKKYVLKFKRLTGRKPHQYCFKDVFYYHVLAIIHARNHQNHYKTDQVFNLNDLDFNLTFKQNLKEKSKPDCFTISEDKGVDLRVLGYKSQVFNESEKTLFYHCKDQYFMGEYVFSDLQKETPENLIQSLRERFNPEITHSKNFVISDPNGNYLYFTDTGFFLSLKFFNINNKVIKNVLNQFGKQKESNQFPPEDYGLNLCD